MTCMTAQQALAPTSCRLARYGLVHWALSSAFACLQESRQSAIMSQHLCEQTGAKLIVAFTQNDCCLPERRSRFNENRCCAFYRGTRDFACCNMLREPLETFMETKDRSFCIFLPRDKRAKE
ncbi:hypothetical protein CPC08DRAFT_703846 [Agrocybe pediades]|nr:hypothetical protein CPC08DRAFT_703846 [Agrocybe pediades]